LDCENILRTGTGLSIAVNESWVYQGRQSHGWFGTGTGPNDGGSEASTRMNELFRPSNAAQRVDYVVASIIFRVPRSERSP